MKAMYEKAQTDLRKFIRDRGYNNSVITGVEATWVTPLNTGSTLRLRFTLLKLLFKRQSSFCCYTSIQRQPRSIPAQMLQEHLKTCSSNWMVWTIFCENRQSWLKLWLCSKRLLMSTKVNVLPIKIIGSWCSMPELALCVWRRMIKMINFNDFQNMHEAKIPGRARKM